MAERKGLTLTDVLITVVIGFVFAVIYSLWGAIYTVLQPLGLHLNELAYGMWFIAAVVAYLILRKPGVALLAEFAAGAGETIVTLQFDVFLIVYALLQGLACEIIFALFKYESTRMMTAVYAGIAAALITLPIDWFYGYLAEVATWNIVLMFSFRIISGALIAGVLAHLIYQALSETGVLKFVGSRKLNHDEGL